MRGTITVIAWILSLATFLLPCAVFAQPRVERVVTATADARDVVTVGERSYVATEGGLLVLRGPTVERTLGATDGLPGARLRSVSLVDGDLWVGAVEGTARVVIEGDELRVSQTFEPRRVRRVVGFGDSLWLASHGGGLCRLRGDSVERVPLGVANAYVRLTDLLVHEGELWVATHGVGILRLGPDGSVRSRIREGDGLPSAYVWRLAERDGRVVATTIDGIAVFGTGGVERQHAWTATARQLPVRDVRAIEWSDGALWLGTYGAGLYRAPLDGGRPRRVGRDESVHALADTSAGLLVAHAGGVGRADGQRVVSIAGGGLPSGDVTAMAHAFGTLWVGTFGHGLARMRRGAFESASTERWALDRRINDLAVTGRGRAERLWIATDRGLYWHDGRIFSRIEDPNGPSWIHNTSLHVDGAGAVWVTTGRELCRHRDGRWRCWTGDATFPVAQLHAVTTDAEGRVWVGGLHGLYRFDPANGRFERHTVSSGDLNVDWVTALLPWGRGVMVGTYHGGLSIGGGDGFVMVREGQGGLPSGWVNPHALQQIGDEVWMGTLERGLVVGRPGQWRRLTTADGLPSDDVTDVLADRDGVWVATRGGLARVSRP